MNNTTKISIIVCILLVLGVAGYVVYSDKHKDDAFVKEVQRNITPEDRKVYEDRITDTKTKLESTTDAPARYDFYLYLGYTEYALGHLQSSKEYFEEALKINKEQYDVYNGLFQTQVDMKDNEGAESSIKKAISIRKGNAELWRKYIQFKMNIGANNDEINGLFVSAENDTRMNGDKSNNTDIYTFYAPWLEKIGSYQAAIDYYNKAIDANPDRKPLYQAEIDRIKKLIK